MPAHGSQGATSVSSRPNPLMLIVLQRRCFGVSVEDPSSVLLLSLTHRNTETLAHRRPSPLSLQRANVRLRLREPHRHIT